VDGALRELLEETGLSPKSVAHLGGLGQIPAVETGRVHLFLVDCETAGPAFASLDPGEDLTTELLPIIELPQLIATGDMDCIACVAASYKLLLTITEAASSQA
jgi:8-oxo-dGTP pyrophosphatase MutT (NUDIX family)